MGLQPAQVKRRNSLHILFDSSFLSPQRYLCQRSLEHSRMSKTLAVETLANLSEQSHLHACPVRVRLFWSCSEWHWQMHTLSGIGDIIVNRALSRRKQPKDVLENPLYNLSWTQHVGTRSLRQTLTKYKNAVHPNLSVQSGCALKRTQYLSQVEMCPNDLNVSQYRHFSHTGAPVCFTINYTGTVRYDGRYPTA